MPVIEDKLRKSVRSLVCGVYAITFHSRPLHPAAKDVGTRKFSQEGILLNDNTEINTEIRLEFIYTDKMEFHVIELPKLPRELPDGCSRLELWAKSFFF